MQPIKLKLKDHCVTAVMCQIRTDHDKALIRLSAMQKRTSMFALLFAEDGILLNANQAALRKYGPDCIGGTCSVHCLWPSCKDGLPAAWAATDFCLERPKKKLEKNIASDLCLQIISTPQ